MWAALRDLVGVLRFVSARAVAHELLFLDPEWASNRALWLRGWLDHRVPLLEQAALQSCGPTISLAFGSA